MGNDKTYVYGQTNGSEYDDQGDRRTHWDPRIEVQAYPGMSVQIGVVPPTAGTVEGAQWISDNGQFLQLDRSGLNRLIEALQDAGSATFGRDRW